MIKDGILYSDTFDWECYLQNNPDIADDYHEAGGAYAHWINHGQYEGRAPGCAIGPAPIDGGGGPGGGDVQPSGGGGSTSPGYPAKDPNLLLIVAVAIGVIILFKKVKI